LVHIYIFCKIQSGIKLKLENDTPDKKENSWHIARIDVSVAGVGALAGPNISFPIKQWIRSNTEVLIENPK